MHFFFLLLNSCSAKKLPLHRVWKGKKVFKAISEARTQAVKDGCQPHERGM